MKKAFLLILAIGFSLSLLAQLQRSVPVNIKSAPRREVQQIQNFPAVRETITQNFESYTDFSLDLSPWTTRDVDGSLTYGITNYTFLHSNEAMAFIVFNPASTTPTLSGDPALQPHGGSKYAACFASQTPPNNDWIISPQIALGSNGHLKFWVKSYTDQYGLERYKVGVSTTNTEPGSFTIISSGTYLEAPATGWEQKDFNLSDYEGMNIYIGIQCVSSDAFIFMLDDMEITSQAAGNSTLTGKVSDAINGNPVPNALVSIAGLSDNTDVNGDYTITGIPAGVLNANFTSNLTSGNAPLGVQFTDLSSEGTHTVTASATGYTNYSNSGVVITEGGTLELQIAMSPTLATGQYRFVLTWGEQPLDLDSHLKTPVIEGSAYHIYYDSQGSSTTPPYVILDIDDVTSYGPETTTIYNLYPGEYHYFIYNYSGSPEITTSNAVVQIFNESGLLHTLQVPTTGTGRYWDVCTLNGTTGVISIINNVIETEPGGLPKLTPDQMKKKPVPAGRNLVSWGWNFGDGGTSTLQNPSHTYTANGSYTVSLTVSDGVNSNTETKNAYIQVGPAGVDAAEWEKEISIYPNPANDQLNINSAIRVESVALFDLSGKQKISKVECGGNFSVNLSSLPEGIYILRIVTEKGSMQRKVNIRR
jgi:PKD repeat protein